MAFGRRTRPELNVRAAKKSVQRER